jgi:guanylate kinase
MITIIAGKSASGKDTMQRRLLESGKYQPLVPYTTRPIRDGEQEGREYHFVSKDEFKQLANQDFFAEIRSYHTNVGGVDDVWSYATTKVDPNAAEYLLILDIKGAETYVKLYGPGSIRFILLEASDEIREKRAIERGTFDRIDWDRRLKDDTIEFSKEKIEKIEALVPDFRRLENEKNYKVRCYTRVGSLDHEVRVEDMEEAKRVRTEWALSIGLRPEPSMDFPLYPTIWHRDTLGGCIGFRRVAGF